MTGRALQLTDPACCGLRLVDEDGCCVICGRDFYDPETGAEVGDGTRIANECLRDTSFELLKALEWMINYHRDDCAACTYAQQTIAKARGET